MNSMLSRIAGAVVRWHDLPGDGDPVVFIHGLGCASSYEYPRLTSDPALAGRRAILIDLPGSGFSEKPADYDYSTTHQAEVVAEVLAHLGVSRYFLYGHSMGGSIAIQLAERACAQILALAVSEPNFHAGGGEFSRRIVEQTEQAFMARGFRQMVEAETSAWKGCLQNTAPWAVWRGARSLVEGVTPSWWARFCRLSCPTALIVGAYSLPDPDAQEAVAVGIPLHVIADAGHSMSWENPSALAEALARVFIR
ncbi:alpha/beta hydrolase [Pluralibacter sp.]|uniref:alpha/beta fold hydrolase n=1 Tax=Pluralibacter sp. TaxID=1920032 RepID=UPI0025F235DA|nr:alpha/beta hydrolase [Pluralibacter sp.]MBV8042364.1 alpha/beta hydrolase [Pluralibacter sp.]